MPRQIESPSIVSPPSLRELGKAAIYSYNTAQQCQNEMKKRNAGRVRHPAGG